MAKRASEFLSAVGKFFEISKAFVDEVVRVVVQYATADRNRTLAEVCDFDYVNPDITEGHFPITIKGSIQHGCQEVEMKTFHFNRAIGSNEAIREMGKEGYHSAELLGGLAYAKANPDEQRKYPIVILGSVWRHFDGYRLVPYLDGGLGTRRLDLDWFDLVWDSDCRFLGVRK